MTRLIIGIMCGILLSFISVSIFDQWNTLIEAQRIFENTNNNVFQATSRAISTLVGANFSFDIFNYFQSLPYTIQGFFQPAFFACFFLGFISGAISIGIKKGLIASFLVIIITFLLWIILSIFSGEDLMALFQGTELIKTIGGTLSAILSGMFGGILGGYLTGNYPKLKQENYNKD